MAGHELLAARRLLSAIIKDRFSPRGWITGMDLACCAVNQALTKGAENRWRRRVRL